MEKTLVGVDLGGTNIRAALALSPTTPGEHVSQATPAEDGPDAVLDAIADAVTKAAAGKSLDGVAIGIPGPLDPESGIVFAAPHLKGWTNIDAAAKLQQRVGAPVAIHNDASLACYAEWVAGAGQGAQQMVFITASTGVGGGLIVNGQLISGFAGTAGEVGHIALNADAPACGQNHQGCLEGTASGTALANRAREAIARGEETTLRALKPGDINAVTIENAANAGDILSLKLWHHAGRTLGRAIGGLINLLSPEIVVIGGGMINAGELLFAPLRLGVTEMAFEVPAQRCRIVEAGLGTDAGLVGAVAWAARSFGAS